MPKVKKKKPSPIKAATASRKKKRRAKKFRVTIDANGVATIVGRPKFNSRAEKLIGKAQKGQDLDRRHLIHYDEEIRPFGTLVLTKVFAKHGTATGALVKSALASVGCVRLPNNDAAIFNRLISEVNSSVVNLVPDDASINKAIEIVRANLRKLRLQWSTDPEVKKIFSEMDTKNYHKAMGLLKLNAKLTLIIAGATTDISRAVQEINKDLIEDIDAVQDVSTLYHLIGDLQNSVTFDISSKASREKIAFTNQWRREKEALEVNAEGGVDSADELLAHLVKLIAAY